MILTVVEDLIFLSKIQETGKALSVEVRAASVPDALLLLREVSARGLLIDLNHRSGGALELIQKLKAEPATADIPVVGFLSHVQTDLAASAHAAGCDMVLARSVFVKQLPGLLAKLDAPKSESTTPSN